MMGKQAIKTKFQMLSAPGAKSTLIQIAKAIKKCAGILTIVSLIFIWTIIVWDTIAESSTTVKILLALGYICVIISCAYICEEISKDEMK